MLLKTDIKLMKKFSILVCLSCLCTSFSYAQVIDCDDPTSSSLKKICSDQFKDIRQKLDTQSMTAFLISDAPQRLLVDTHQLWLNRLQQCKSLACYQQQMDFRIDDLNFYTSLNQSLTQHYLKFEHGAIAKQPVHLQVHQLSKDKIKIEGNAYRSPNNRIETQTISFLAYTTPDQKQNITDNENNCHYQFNFQKAILSVKSESKACNRFVGVYRVYD